MAFTEVTSRQGLGLSSRHMGINAIKVRSVEVSSAELLACNTTAPVLVPAPGAKKALIFHGCVLCYDHKGTDYATNSSWTVADGTTGTTLSTTLANWLTAAGADKSSTLKAITTDVAINDNESLVLTCTADHTTGNGILWVHTYYSVIEFPY